MFNHSSVKIITRSGQSTQSKTYIIQFHPFFLHKGYETNRSNLQSGDTTTYLHKNLRIVIPKECNSNSEFVITHEGLEDI